MNKPNSRYQFVVELFRIENEKQFVLRQHPVENIDWAPVVEAACFEEMRHGAREEAATSLPGGEVEPVWSASEGGPYIEGVTVSGSRPGAGAVVAAVRFFQGAAQGVAEELVEIGTLRQGEIYHYRVAAYPGGAAERSFSDAEETERIAVAPPICGERTLAEVTEGAAVTCDAGHMERGDFPVFLPRKVIDEATAQTAAVEGVETGGILIGNLHRDVENGDLGMVVTAQIPATGTRQNLSSLTFTAETWAAVDGALKLRGGSESMLGWWHSHPAKNWCGEECAREQRLVCPRQQCFFSDTDKNLHRTIFPKAWCVGLLITNSDAGMRYSMWGWRRGTVQRRAFAVLEDSSKTTAAVTA